MRSAIMLLALSFLIFRSDVVPAQDGQKASQAPTPPDAQIPDDTPVITLSGFCASDLVTDSVGSVLNAAAPATEKGFDPACKTTITRKQYEQLVTAIGGKPKPGLEPKFAKQFVEMLLFAEKARETGGQKDPAFQEKLRYNYMQGLGQFAMVHMQREADDITDADVEKYFQEHPERFVRISLQQIAVPKQKDHGDAAPTKIDPAEQQEMHRLALTIQKQAAAGWNMERLQAKAYKAANDESVPDIDLGHPVPEEVPVEYRKLVFDLKPGQVSAVAEDEHEYLIFKCLDKQTIPADERKKFYGWLRMRDSRQALKDMVQVQFDQQYFLTPAKQGGDAATSGKAH
jgi:PPIC-type PPIASE domain